MKAILVVPHFYQMKGFNLNNELYFFKLFLGNVLEAYVLVTKKKGFTPTITELGRLVWHDASIEYIVAIHEMFPDFGLSISNLSTHEISIAFIDGFRILVLNKWVFNP